MSPYDADDLTEIIVRRGEEFVIFRSPDTADHAPAYQEVGAFATLVLAEANLSDC
jgi:hypothetical protein